MRRTIVPVVLFAALMFSGCLAYVERPDLNLEAKSYPKPEKVSSLSFALAQPLLSVDTALAITTDTGLAERIKYDVQKIKCFMTGEAQKILLSKGFTITDTFESHNAMTFTQKRNTSALFYPEIKIEMRETSERVTTQVLMFRSTRTEGKFKIKATVNIIMMEPLSGEKLWVKSIPVSGYDDVIEYSPYRYGGNQLNGQVVPEDLVPLTTKIDDMIVQIAKEVLVATNKYVERQEFEFLNEDIVKLKGIKRY